MGAAELIPTEVRATSTAFLNVVSRIANVFAARTVCKGVFFVCLYEVQQWQLSVSGQPSEGR